MGEMAGAGTRLPLSVRGGKGMDGVCSAPSDRAGTCCSASSSRCRGICQRVRFCCGAVTRLMVTLPTAKRRSRGVMASSSLWCSPSASMMSSQSRRSAPGSNSARGGAAKSCAGSSQSSRRQSAWQGAKRRVTRDPPLLWGEGPCRPPARACADPPCAAAAPAAVRGEMEAAGHPG